MKSFWISVGRVVVMVTTILFNAAYINNVGKDLLHELESRPQIGEAETPNRVAHLTERWEAAADLISLSANHNLVDRVGEQARAMVAAVKCGDVFGYQAAVALFRDALEDLLRPEKLQGAV